jgi:hypothetical protein
MLIYLGALQWPLHQWKLGGGRAASEVRQSGNWDTRKQFTFTPGRSIQEATSLRLMVLRGDRWGTMICSEDSTRCRARCVMALGLRSLNTPSPRITRCVGFCRIYFPLAQPPHRRGITTLSPFFHSMRLNRSPGLEALVLPRPQLPRSSLSSLASSPQTPRTPSCGSSFIFAPANRNSTDSWTSSNGPDEQECDWKPEQVRLLSRVPCSFFFPIRLFASYCSTDTRCSPSSSRNSL